MRSGKGLNQIQMIGSENKGNGTKRTSVGSFLLIILKRKENDFHVPPLRLDDAIDNGIRKISSASEEKQVNATVGLRIPLTHSDFAET